MMKAFHKFLTFCAFAAFLGVCACSDDEPGPISLPKDQPKQVTTYANTTSSSIHFTAAAPWTAYVQDVARSTDWIHLDQTSGEAGDIYLTFWMDENTTGASRTVNIVIVCGDTSIYITITQSSEAGEDEGDEPLPTQEQPMILITAVTTYYNYNGDGYDVEEDGVTTYRLVYDVDHKHLSEVWSSYRDDCDGMGDDYCDTETRGYLAYSGLNAHATYEQVSTYHPSGRVEKETSEHDATLDIQGRVVSGWYQWDEDDAKTEYTIAYDSNGYIKSSTNYDYEDGETHYFTWTNGDLTSLKCDSGYVQKLLYGDTSLANLHTAFDLNWFLVQESECFDFAAGDVSRLFAVAGMLGKPSSHLMTSWIDENDEQRYYMTYTKNDATTTIVEVDEYYGPTDNPIHSTKTTYEIVYVGGIK